MSNQVSNISIVAATTFSYGWVVYQYELLRNFVMQSSSASSTKSASSSSSPVADAKKATGQKHCTRKFDDQVHIYI